PQGDTYADLLFTMIERRDRRPPVTYTTFQARDLGGDTAELFKTAARQAYERFAPKAMLVGSSCTAELIQDDPGGLAQALHLPVPVVPLELPAYQRKENWGAAETFYQVVRAIAGTSRVERAPLAGRRPRCNLLGPTALGFRHRDDVIEITRLLQQLGVDVHVTAPLNASPDDIARLTQADFNVVLYPETAGQAAQWLQRIHGQPFTKTIPIGVGATREFIAEVGKLAGLTEAEVSKVLNENASRAPWYSKSVDSTYLTDKRVFVFGDASHAVAAARVAARELGFKVVGLGTYSREFAREVREAAKLYGVEPLISDDYLEVEARIAEAQPELVLGTQMERHIAKRLRLPCAVISAPVHVQDFPARYAPQMGFEGANVLFDTWVHPLMMGLEEHLLTMFREDFEFHEGAAASHLSHAGGHSPAVLTEPAPQETDPPAAAPQPARTSAEGPAQQTAAGSVLAPDGVPGLPSGPHSISIAPGSLQVVPKPLTGATEQAGPTTWSADAQKELQKIPFFVRGKARRNTERFAAERGVSTITVETLYDAKAHFGR
ncbi:MAG: ferredoxin:protochlorophyllide reductase (ATP-dependent) subunit B, partial [Rubrivivax sp.]